jgi:hypothetical protein
MAQPSFLSATRSSASRVLDTHFVIAQRGTWDDLLAGDAQGQMPPTPRELAPRIQSHEDASIVLTYVHLKRRGLPVHLQPHFVPGAICVASTVDYGIRTRPDGSFVIGSRGDGPRSALCDLQVVQNPLNLRWRTDVLIPLWPQPDLVPRNPARGMELRNIVFKGDVENLDEGFRSPDFCAALGKRGLRLVLEGRPASGPVFWGDYTEADLVLAVRNLTVVDAKVKPPSKLTNAWHAGVPALLGPEPAFQLLRQSEHDYIEVRTPADVLEGIDRLQADPGRYQAMLKQAALRSPEFNEEAIARLWINVLETAARRLPRWRLLPRPLRSLRLVPRAMMHKVYTWYGNYHRNNGRRILDPDRAGTS